MNVSSLAATFICKLFVLHTCHNYTYEKYGCYTYEKFCSVFISILLTDVFLSKDCPVIKMNFFQICNFLNFVNRNDLTND